MFRLPGWLAYWYGGAVNTTRIPILLCPLLIIALICPVQAQDEQLPVTKEKRSSLVALPYAFYSPETEFGGGAGALYSFRPAGSLPGNRPSNVKLGITITQKKQLIVALVPELYFRNEAYYLNAWIAYYHYPDKFWGIGNDMPDDAEENYSMDYVRTFLNLQKRVGRGLYVGCRYQFEHIKLTETEDGGLLHPGTIGGSEPDGGLASGLGFIVTYDTRNHIYYPTTGSFHQFYGAYFGDIFGSDYRFSSYTLDLRKYFPLPGEQVCALQAFGMFTGGTVPFQMLALMGGNYVMRGYHFGRYRDENMVALQTEYRFPVFWRFGGAAFAGLGDVAPDIDAFRLKEFKYSLGIGVRFTIDTKERINARLDFGFGRHGNNGFYAMVAEAF